MKNRKLLTIVLSLTAVMLFFVILDSGRATLQEQENALLASAQATGATFSESVKSVDDEIMNPETPMALKYERYPISFVYFAVNGESIPVYSSPNGDKRVIRTAADREKLNYLETVTMERSAAPSAGTSVDTSATAVSAGAGMGAGAGTETWYHVYWYTDGKGELLPDGSQKGAEKNFGFIPEGSAEKRRIRMDAMADSLKKADQFAAEGDIAHISNYKNGNGKPPLYRGGEKDGQGNPRSQSAPGYEDLSDKEEFTYLEDGTLIKVLEPSVSPDGTPDSTGREGNYRKVLCLSDGKTYYVPLKYIPRTKTMTELTKAVVIDRKNQNEASFEKIDGTWSCTSYTMATTGTKNKYAAPTPLGYFLMIEKRPQFYYYKDGTTELQGYAPFVMRFCGGAYIHGVPVSYEYKGTTRITPPTKEFSPTMGTVPLSHKCVRNYTSHAEFLYGWYEEGKTAVIVIE